MGKSQRTLKNELSDGSLESSPALKIHTSRPELIAIGKSLREKCPRASHAACRPPPNRPDPVELLEASSTGRIPQLIPIRY